MTTTQSSSLAARAAMMADLDDLAEEATRVLGGARAARLDPDALTSLAGAAMALGAESLAVYQAARDAYGSDTELLEEGAAVGTAPPPPCMRRSSCARRPAPSWPTPGQPSTGVR